MTKEQSNGLKVLCALMVFFCHVNPYVNLWGFIPVGCFFFISGYGCIFSKKNPLYRCVRLGMVYLFVCGIYSLVSGEVNFSLPFGWFFLIYGVQMFFIWIKPDWRFVLVLDFILSVAMWKLEFTYPWYTSMAMFPMGMRVAMKGNIDRRILAGSLAFGATVFLYSYGFPLLLWMLSVPLTFILIHFRNVYVPLHKLGFMTMPFFVIHCLFLDVLGVRHDMGFPLFAGSMTLSIMLAFFGSAAGAYLLHKFFNVVFNK